MISGDTPTARTPEDLSDSHKQAAAFLKRRLSEPRNAKKGKQKPKCTQGLNPGGHAFTGAFSRAVTSPSVA